jgi:hypothetical protein
VAPPHRAIEAERANGGGLKMPMSDHERRGALGKWGEEKALALLRNARFKGVRDVNKETHNHPFGISTRSVAPVLSSASKHATSIRSAVF